MGSWQEVAHTADLALRVWGASLEDLFRTAAVGMGALVGTAATGGAGTVRSLTLTAPDAEALLVDWLNELLYLQDLTQRIFTSITFEALSETYLRARIVGFPLIESRAQIKATTFHNLAIKRSSRGFETVVVFDV